MATKNLGKVAITPKGEFNETTTYQKLDVVTYDGSSYMALKETTGNVPTSEFYWQLIATKGSKGETGEQGIQGERGETGPQGPKGEDGTGVTILGSYATLDELETAHPTGNAGDSYLIEGNLYVWSLTSSTWENVGNIKGPQGERGIQGIQGEKGDKGDTGEQGPQGEQGIAGKDGINGTDGYTPKKGTDYYTEADKQEMINLILEALPSAEGVEF